MRLDITEKQAFQYCEDTKLLHEKTIAGDYKLAERLCFIKVNNLAEPQYGGFDLFLDDMRIKPSTATHMMRVYDLLVIRFDIPVESLIRAGGYTRVYEILPLCTDRKTAITLLQMCENAPSRENIKEIVRQAKAHGNSTCLHECTYTIKVCKGCKAKWKFLEEEN